MAKLDRSFKLWIIILILIATSFMVSTYNFLLFHTLIEFFSITVAVLTLFLVQLDVYKSNENFLHILGYAYFFVAIIDLLHTLTYKGMNIFPAYPANISTQLWVAARALQATSLLIAYNCRKKQFNHRIIIPGLALVTIALLASIFVYHVFPDCYIENQGLTRFKIIIEYVISTALLVTLYLMNRSREEFLPRVYTTISLSIVFTVFSELAFTFYVSVYGVSNVIGHLFKLAAFYLVFDVLVVEVIREPRRILSADLETSQTRFEAFKDSATDGFLLMNRDLIIEEANPTWLSRAQVQGNVIGKHILEVFPDSIELEQRLEFYRSVIETGVPVELDNIRSPSGAGLNYQIKAFRVADGVGLIARDITNERQKDLDALANEKARNKLQEELLKERLLVEQTQELERLKSEFMNTATHEIRTPITSIKGYTELIRESLSKGDYEIADQYFSVVNRNIDRLEVLSNDLLDIQRLESGRIKLNQKHVSLKRFCFELQSQFVPVVSETAHKINFDCDDSLTIFCDAVRLNQVIVNLVNNAVKYSPEGSVVNVWAKEANDFVVFSIEDQGIGLSQEDLDKLFTPFPDIQVNGVKHGSGLGLSISKGIVVLHGGEIWAESKGVGKGSIFRFTIPV